MVNWEKKWRNFSQGWFAESGRHSNARKFGRAGGKYKSYFADKVDVKRVPPDRLEGSMLPADMSGEIMVPERIDIDLKNVNIDEEISKLQKEAEFKKMRQEADIKEKESKSEFETEQAKAFKEQTGEKKEFAKEVKILGVVDKIKFGLKNGIPINDTIKEIAGGEDADEDKITKIKKSIGSGQLAELVRIEREGSAFVKTKKFVSDKLKGPMEAIGAGAQHIIPRYETSFQKLKRMQDENALRKGREEQRREEKRKAVELIQGDPDSDPLNSANAGVFDALGNMGVSGEISPLIDGFDFGQSEEELDVPDSMLYPHSYQTDKLVNDFNDSIPDLTRNDVDNIYQKGVDSFKSGDREALVDAISDVEFENLKLRDRRKLAESVRTRVMQDQNTIEILDKSDRGSGIADLSSLFGGAVSGKLAAQTKKIHKVSGEIMKEITKSKIRAENLRHKLDRIDRDTDYGKFEPKYPKRIIPYKTKTTGVFNMDIGNPLLSAGVEAGLSKANPVLGKNPVLAKMPKVNVAITGKLK